MCHCFSRQTPAALFEARSAEHTLTEGRGGPRKKVFIKPRKTRLEDTLGCLQENDILTIRFEDINNKEGEFVTSLTGDHILI